MVNDNNKNNWTDMMERRTNMPAVLPNGAVINVEATYKRQNAKGAPNTLRWEFIKENKTKKENKKTRSRPRKR